MKNKQTGSFYNDSNSHDDDIDNNQICSVCGKPCYAKAEEKNGIFSDCRAVSMCCSAEIFTKIGQGHAGGNYFPKTTAPSSKKPKCKTCVDEKLDFTEAKCHQGYWENVKRCPDCTNQNTADNNLKIKFIRENSQLLGLKLSARELDKKYVEWLETEYLLMKAEKGKR